MAKKNQHKQHIRILVVDDDPSLRSLLSFRLENEGYSIDTCDSAEEVLKLMEGNFDCNLVLLDVMLPKMNGDELLPIIKKEYSEIQIILMTAYPSVKMGVKAIKEGAFDFIPKPFDMVQLTKLIENALNVQTLQEENQALRQILEKPMGFSDLIGKSKKMNAVRQLIRQSAKSRATVMITGASGTGKEVVARTIHQNSLVHKEAFIAVNCGAIPTNLVESELFGHEKGSFTGADKQKKGKFEQANNGTIFLDEIGELPFDAQVKLLRVLQEKEVTRVGGSETIKLNIRVITATNQNLAKLAQEGLFREDLFYRIALFIIELPTLNERGKDVLLLADFFLKKNSKLEGRGSMVLAKSAQDFLLKKSWPGNVRMLDNCIYRTILMCENKSVIEEEDIQLAPEIGKIQQGETGDIFGDEILPLRVIEAKAIKAAIRITKGNIKKAAEQLDVSRVTFYRKMKEYNLEKSGDPV